MNLDNVCYKNTFIKNVILRLDFFGVEESLNKSLDKDLIDIIKNFFPIAEPKNVIGKEFLFNFGTPKDSLSENQTEKKEWHFHTFERKATFYITESFLGVEMKEFISFEKVLDFFNKILVGFHNAYKGVVFNRLALRYINEISLDEPKPLEWDRYLKKELLSIFLCTPTPEFISRAFHKLIIKKDVLQLKFQFGIHNPDFPAIIKKKVFILDLDCSYTGIVESSEVRELLVKQHEMIQEQFEFSITEEYRELIRNK